MCEYKTVSLTRGLCFGASTHGALKGLPWALGNQQLPPPRAPTSAATPAPQGRAETWLLHPDIYVSTLGNIYFFFALKKYEFNDRFYRTTQFSSHEEGVRGL